MINTIIHPNTLKHTEKNQVLLKEFLQPEPETSNESTEIRKNKIVPYVGQRRIWTNCVKDMNVKG